MTSASTQSVTDLLQAWASGDQRALDQLLPWVYDELRRQARRYMRAQPAGQTLQTTGLVHEAYLRLTDNRQWRGRAERTSSGWRPRRRARFWWITPGLGARLSARERCGRSHEDATGIAGAEASVDASALHEALQLAELDPRKSELAGLRYFGGLRIEEAAAVLGVSPATAKRECTGRAWLRRELSVV